MLKTIWMSDLHFTAEGRVQGHDPRARLEAAAAHIAAQHADASLCIITGDLVDRGTQADYAALLEHLEPLPMPCLPMAGNHDNRALLREAFDLPDTCMADFIQYSVPREDGVILCLDTQKTGSDAGTFCPARMDWLREQLEEAGQKPVYLFLHHPPHALGLPMQDTENMENGDAFLDLALGFDCVKYMCIGHVHRPITGTVRGIPFATMRSVLYQAPAPRPAWDWTSFAPAQEAPAIGVVTIDQGAVTIHYDQPCGYEIGTE